MAAVKKTVEHMISTANRGENLKDSKPPTDVIECMSKLERLIGSDWHRLGRVLGLGSDCLDDIGKFTNFDLTTRAEKVIAAWARSAKSCSVESLQQALTKLDRDILLIADFPICKSFIQLPSDVMTFCVAHMMDVPSLCISLAWQGIIGPDSLSFISGGQEEYKKASRLLQTVTFMGSSALLSLCSILESSNQSHLASRIGGCLQPQHLSEDNRMSKLSAYSATLTHKSNWDTPKSSTKKINNSSSAESAHQRKSKDKQQRQKRSRSLFTRKSKSRDSETGDGVDGGFDEFYCPISAV